MGRITGITRRSLTAAAAGALATAAWPDEAVADEAVADGQGRHRQFRGMWLATVANRDWPLKPSLPAAEQRASLLAFLDTAVERRLNAVVFQVRPTADALWPSPYEPWSEWLTGTQGQDPG